MDFSLFYMADPLENPVRATDTPKHTHKNAHGNVFLKCQGVHRLPAIPLYIGPKGPRLKLLPVPELSSENGLLIPEPKGKSHPARPPSPHSRPHSPFSPEYFYLGRFSVVDSLGGGFCWFSISFLGKKPSLSSFCFASKYLSFFILMWFPTYRKVVWLIQGTTTHSVLFCYKNNTCQW